MSDPHERLKEARLSAGYKTAAAAAAAMGVNAPTYTHHENGTAGLSRAGERYARFFRVNFEWLMTGAGEMRRKLPGQDRRIPIHGLVGAGARVEMLHDDGGAAPDWIDMPEPDAIAALVVKGDSQLPRFREGEVLLYDPRPTDPESLINQYAVVQKANGERLIKILRRGAGDGRWRLDSLNAEPDENVELIGVWRFLGLLAPAPKPVPVKRKR